MTRCLNVTVVARGTPLPRHCPLLLVADHVSWLGACALGSVEGMLFVTKAEVSGWPVMGRIAGGFGNFFHRRGNLRDAARVKDKIARALTAGWRATVFPEGTSGDGHQLMPFYPAMVQAAIDAGAMAQPVAIRYLDLDGRLNATVPFTGDQTLIDSLRRILREPAIIADLPFGNPLSAAARTRREITVSCHDLIAQTLGVPVSNTVADPWR
jgi:1-acyl-sn-glycerol-3-phosphate acyltransferase